MTVYPEKFPGPALSSQRRQILAAAKETTWPHSKSDSRTNASADTRADATPPSTVEPTSPSNVAPSCGCPQFRRTQAGFSGRDKRNHRAHGVYAKIRFRI